MNVKNENTFTPHIYAEGDIPALCFAPGHYLSWFRGYRFQVSATEKGIGNLGSSMTTLNNDLMLARELIKDLRPLIAFSHVCEAVASLDDFWNFLGNDHKLFNDFMAMTDDCEDIQCRNFDISKIDLLVNAVELNEYKKIITDQTNYVASKPILSWIPQQKGYALLGNLILRRESVLVYRQEGERAFQISFPDYNSSLCAGVTSGEKEYYSILWSRLPWIVFDLTGIALNAVGILSKFAFTPVHTQKKTDEITDNRDYYDFINKSLTLLNNSATAISVNPYG